MSKHKLVRRRRLPVGPFLLTGVVAVGAVVAAPYAEAAVSGTAASAARASVGSPREAARPTAPAQVRKAGEASHPRAPQRVVAGSHLEAKPPPWVLPVARYHLTGRFGMSSGLWAHGHTGLDFAAPDGAGIRAIAPGTVTSVGYDGAYGNKTEIRLDHGTVLWFCHQSATEVAVGQRVFPGQLIGRVGSTGNVTGPHLHLEVRPNGGDPIDPEAWLPAHHLRP